MASFFGLTTNELIRSVKVRALVPINQDTFTEEDIINFLNDEMLLGLVPTILLEREEYLVGPAHVIDIIPNISEYPLPERSLGNKLREVNYRDQMGNEYEMTRIAVDDRYNYLMNTITTQNWKQFYVQGSSLTLFPKVGDSPTGQLVMWYYLRPNSLVKNDAVATISAIDREAGRITVSNLPSNFNPTSLYDFIKRKSPHNIIKFDIPVLSVNTTSKIITIDPSLLPESLVVGDILALAGETCIPNVPTELHQVLAQRVACRILEGLGDSQGLQNAMAKLAEMESKTQTLIDNRVEGAPRKVVNRNNVAGVRRIRSRIF
jgi:hypothetical protein